MRKEKVMKDAKDDVLKREVLKMKRKLELMEDEERTGEEKGER